MQYSRLAVIEKGGVTALYHATKEELTDRTVEEDLVSKQRSKSIYLAVFYGFKPRAKRESVNIIETLSGGKTHHKVCI